MLTEQGLEALYHELGRRIAHARKAAGLTPQALGKLVGLSRPSIANLEAGRQRAPIHTLWRIADALNTPVSLLLPELSRIPLPRDIVNRKLVQERRLRGYSSNDRKSIKRFLESHLTTNDPANKVTGEVE